jgi:hypothetical protein
VSVRANSTFPFGYNDGPIWAGKGFTVAAQGGVALRRGAVSLTVAPLLFLAQNAAFRLMPNGQSGNLVYEDGPNAGAIDHPQRFGHSAYGRLDPGQSTLRVDWHALAVGVSTANQYWGPATEFPIILGNNAAGFPHAFLGTARPVDLWLLRLHWRLVWGRLAQSAFSPETASAGVRFAGGLVLDFTSRWVPGLEFGFTRFSHTPWRSGGPSVSDLLRMLHSQQTANERGDADHQMASAFARWVLPHSGFEVYGEYGRQDYNLDVRDFIEEPDHAGGYTIGFRKVSRRPGNRLFAVRVEVQNLQFSRLAQGRNWAPFYTHGSTVRQGHTQLGQLLGSEAGVGGAGTVLAVESYSPHGRWTWSWTRMLRQQRGDPSGAGPPDGRGLDVQHALAVERLVFRGRYDLLARVAVVYELNRNFGGDAFNLNAALGVRASVRR